MIRKRYSLLTSVILIAFFALGSFVFAYPDTASDFNLIEDLVQKIINANGNIPSGESVETFRDLLKRQNSNRTVKISEMIIRLREANNSGANTALIHNLEEFTAMDAKLEELSDLRWQSITEEIAEYNKQGALPNNAEQQAFNGGAAKALAARIESLRKVQINYFNKFISSISLENASEYPLLDTAEDARLKSLSLDNSLDVIRDADIIANHKRKEINLALNDSRTAIQKWNKYLSDLRDFPETNELRIVKSIIKDVLEELKISEKYFTVLKGNYVKLAHSLDKLLAASSKEKSLSLASHEGSASSPAFLSQDQIGNAKPILLEDSPEPRLLSQNIVSEARPAPLSVSTDSAPAAGMDRLFVDLTAAISRLTTAIRETQNLDAAVDTIGKNERTILYDTTLDTSSGKLQP